MDDEPSLMDSLRRHWRAVAIFAVVVAVAAIYSERKLFPPLDEEDEPVVAPATPVAPGDRPTEARPDNKPDAKADARPDEKTDAQPGEADAGAQSVASQTVAVASRPAAVLKGEGKWDESAKVLGAAIAKLNAATSKAGLAVNGRPIAVFTKTDDAGFQFEAMAPLAAAPEGKTTLADGVTIGASPAGKALKFQHRGSYDEIDATYEAIAAYLDEKGLDTKDVIIEEYLTDFKGDDATLDVDIYVLLK